MSSQTTLPLDSLQCRMNNLILESDVLSDNSMPMLLLKNTNTGNISGHGDFSGGAVLQLKSEPSDNIQTDLDNIGRINFTGIDSAGSDTQYGMINVVALETNPGDELGRLNLWVGTPTGLQSAINFNGNSDSTTACEFYSDIELRANAVTVPNFETNKTTAGSTSAPLGGSLTPAQGGGANEFLNQVTSSDDTHKVKLPLAINYGQIKFILNTGSNSVVIRNNADDADKLTLASGKIAMCISTSSGDNWTVSLIS